MRNTQSSISYADETKTERNDGQKWSESSPGSIVTHFCQRSSVTKTQRNPVTQWRPPTSYYVLDVSEKPLIGSSIYVFKYDDPTTDAKYGRREVHVGRKPGLDPGRSNWPSVDFTYQVRRAEVQALLKARDQKVNLALVAAEADKTALLISDRVGKIVRSVSALKKGNFRKAAQAIGLRPKKAGKSAAEMHLEVQYGWVPLMMDIKGAYEELTRKFRDHGVQLKCKSRTSFDGTWPTRLWASGGEGRFLCFVDDRYNVTAEVILWFQVDDPSLLTASSVGLLNPAEIVWELVPFSFIWDWAFPIGDVLGALTAAAGMRFLGGTCTTRVTIERRSYASGNPSVAVPASTGRWIGSGQYVGGARSFEMRRSTYGQSPIPLPYWKSPVSTGHALNALALLRALFK